MSVTNVSDPQAEGLKPEAGKMKAKKKAMYEDVAVKADAVANAKKASKRRYLGEDKFEWKKLSIGLGLLVLTCSGLFSSLSTIFDFATSESANFISVVDQPEETRQVLLGGDPTFVYCAENGRVKVPYNVQQAWNDLSGEMKYARVEEGAYGPTVPATVGVPFAIMDCQGSPLPSGRTIYERYKFKESQMPAFVVANGEKPVQFNRNSFVTPTTIVEFARANTKPTLRDVATTQRLEQHCTARGMGACIIIGHKRGMGRDARQMFVKEILPQFRMTRFVAVDTSTLRLKLDAAIAPPPTEGKKDRSLLSLMCVYTPDRSSDPDALPRSEVATQLETGSAEMMTFIERCATGAEDMREIVDLPSLSDKPRKSYEDRAREAADKANARREGRNVDAVGSSDNVKRSDDVFLDDGDDEPTDEEVQEMLRKLEELGKDADIEGEEGEEGEGEEAPAEAKPVTDEDLDAMDDEEEEIDLDDEA